MDKEQTNSSGREGVGEGKKKRERQLMDMDKSIVIARGGVHGAEGR